MAPRSISKTSRDDQKGAIAVARLNLLFRALSRRHTYNSCLLRRKFLTMNLGADGYIVKPYTMKDLLRKIKEQMQKQQEAKRYSEEKVKEFIETCAEEYESRGLVKRRSKK